MTGNFPAWSKTTSANSTADNSINWSEGQSPSTVNDSARAMMAATASYRDDVSGSLITTGTAIAYILATNQGFSSTPNTGQLVAFVPNLTNGIAPTLTCDSGGTFPIQSSVGVAVAAASLVAGTPYTATFSGSAWLLRDFYGNPFALPLGGMMPYLGATAPNSNFALPFGQAISRTTYATLFAMISTTFGVGDGTTTFNIPDLRGATIAGLGNMGGVDAGRITVAGGNFDGTVLGATGGAQNYILTTPQIPAHTHAIADHNHGLLAATQSAPAGAGVTVPTGFSSTNAANFGTTNNATLAPANTGGGGAHTSMQYTMVLPMILRVI